MKMKQITIIGAGFAALSAARKLRQLDTEAEITLIAPKPELIFLPSLIWIPSGIRKAEDLRIPLDHFLRDNRIRFVTGKRPAWRMAGASC
jgi:sulfide:quinone oxidoreductase